MCFVAVPKLVFEKIKLMSNSETVELWSHTHGFFRENVVDNRDIWDNMFTCPGGVFQFGFLWSLP